MHTAEDVLRRQLSEGIGKLRLQLSDAQQAFQKLAAIDLEQIDDESLPAMAESISKMAGSQFLGNLALIGLILEVTAKPKGD